MRTEYAGLSERGKQIRRMIPESRWFSLGSKYFIPPFRHDSGMIWDSSGGRVADIRGWGHLTGIGSHNLPNEKAAAIQDQIGEHIALLLTENWPKQ